MVGIHRHNVNFAIQIGTILVTVNFNNE
ncbi:unnamed protein product, partial [Rotaria sp. Silwood1]